MFLIGRVVEFHATAGELDETYADGYKTLGQLGKSVKGELGYIRMSLSRNSKEKEA